MRNVLLLMNRDSSSTLCVVILTHTLCSLTDNMRWAEEFEWLKYGRHSEVRIVRRRRQIPTIRVWIRVQGTLFRFLCCHSHFRWFSYEPPCPYKFLHQLELQLWLRTSMYFGFTELKTFQCYTRSNTWILLQMSVLCSYLLTFVLYSWNLFLKFYS